MTRPAAQVEWIAVLWSSLERKRETWGFCVSLDEGFAFTRPPFNTERLRDLPSISLLVGVFLFFFFASLSLPAERHELMASLLKRASLFGLSQKIGILTFRHQMMPTLARKRPTINTGKTQCRGKLRLPLYEEEMERAMFLVIMWFPVLSVTLAGRITLGKVISDEFHGL